MKLNTISRKLPWLLSLLALGIVVLLIFSWHSIRAIDIPLPGNRHVISGCLEVNVHAIRVADIDLDGDPDIVSPIYDSGMIAWWENASGDGSECVRHLVTENFVGADDVFLADVDKDGDVDILGAGRIAYEIAWWENSAGDGSEWTHHVVDNNVSVATSVYGADVDGDGDLDVMGTAFNGISTNLKDLSWWENLTGDGLSWSHHTIESNATNAHPVYGADLDGDGDMDAVSVAPAQNAVRWWENTLGDGSVWTVHTIGPIVNQGHSNDVAVADIDGDGDADVISANYDGDNISWWENEDGTGTTWVQHILTNNFQGALSVTISDLDHDGDLDVLGTAYEGNQVAWWENEDGGGNSWIEHVVEEPYNQAVVVLAADMDTDGDMDILGSKAGANAEIAWWENETIHRIADYPEQAVITLSGNGTKIIQLVDLDRDGDMDLLPSALDTPSIPWYENVGNTAFITHTISTSASAETGSVGTQALDMDRDGDMDVLAALRSDGLITWYENDGSQSFNEHLLTSTALPEFISAVDLDGDGDVDVVSASVGDGLLWHENDGNQLFSSHPVSATLNMPATITPFDLNRDGDQDLIITSETDNLVVWYENDGQQVFTAYSLPHTLTSPTALSIADIDRDADFDMVVAASSGGISWYENDGSQGFAEHNLTTATNARSVNATDADLDGDIDIFASFSTGDGVVWFENDGLQGFTERPVAATSGGRAAYPVDMDRDGDVDIVSALENGDTIAWHENRSGQVTLLTKNTAPISIPAWLQDDMLQIEVVHNGRMADQNIELAALDLLLEESPNDPLTDSEANALIENLHLYLDDGSGTFETDQDILVATVDTLLPVNGMQTITLADGDAGAQIAWGEPRTYFVVPELTANAQSQIPNSFRITYVPMSSLAEFPGLDLPLQLTEAETVSSGTVLAGSPVSTPTPHPSHTPSPTLSPPTTTPLPVITINFQRPSSVICVYLFDLGYIFGERGNGFTYGWNVDNQSYARDRNNPNSPDELYDTFNHMQPNGQEPRYWEISLPNGQYDVHIVAGDPNFFDSIYRIQIEGLIAIDNVPSAQEPWAEAVVSVMVNDGRLTIDNAPGSVNNKINFLTIYPQPAPPTASPTASPSATPTSDATYTPSATPTSDPMYTPSATLTNTPVNTPAPSLTPTPTSQPEFSLYLPYVNR